MHVNLDSDLREPHDRIRPNPASPPFSFPSSQNFGCSSNSEKLGFPHHSTNPAWGTLSLPCRLLGSFLSLTNPIQGPLLLHYMTTPAPTARTEDDPVSVLPWAQQQWPGYLAPRLDPTLLQGPCLITILSLPPKTVAQGVPEIHTELYIYVTKEKSLRPKNLHFSAVMLSKLQSTADPWIIQGLGALMPSQLKI